MLPTLTVLVSTLAASHGATCQSAYGQTACGYDCKAAYGQLRCAQTPAGVCHAAYGQVVCFDPPQAFHTAAPKAQCVAAYGQITRGYHCTSAYGQTRCAQSPGGFCRAEYGDIQCFEPRPEVYAHRHDPRPPPGRASANRGWDPKPARPLRRGAPPGHASR